MGQKGGLAARSAGGLAKREFFSQSVVYPVPVAPRPSFLFLFILLLLLAACAEAAAEIAPTPPPTASPTATATVTPSPTPTVPASACPLPNLPFGSRIAASGSYTETETEAAGPPGCRIERNSCAYFLLVGNLDPSIIFKNEEEPSYQEDFLMHPAMLLPLSRLNKLVTDEWGGAVLLRVTDAYDSLLEHDLGQSDESRRVSLHFEGRSLDLTTWPLDPSRYARLCTLAHCAGFAWVHNEGDHCHASIRANSLCDQCSD